MHIRTVVLAVVLLVGAGCRVTNSDDHSMSSSNASSSSAASTSAVTNAVDPNDPAPPTDLEPIDPYRSDRTRALRDALLADEVGPCWMVFNPSNASAYALSLALDASGVSPIDGPQRMTCTLRLGETKEPRWRPDVQRSAHSSDAARYAEERLHVQRSFMTINEDDAQKLARAWRAVVSRTRYSNFRSQAGLAARPFSQGVARFDGDVYHFGVDGLAGGIESGRGGLAGGLADLADQLRKCVQAPEAERLTRLRKCLNLATKLQAAAERSP
jgi:hypothetical protein